MSADTWDRDQRDIADKRAELLITRLVKLAYTHRSGPAGDDIHGLLDWFLTESRAEASTAAGVTS